jgi:hypothetical protein
MTANGRKCALHNLFKPKRTVSSNAPLKKILARTLAQGSTGRFTKKVW